MDGLLFFSYWNFNGFELLVLYLSWMLWCVGYVIKVCCILMEFINFGDVSMEELK